MTTAVQNDAGCMPVSSDACNSGSQNISKAKDSSNVPGRFEVFVGKLPMGTTDDMLTEIASPFSPTSV
tara:strand:- start:268 stop:471 length:204 start_codon:yes stop_codon:yes gene_type:complete